MDSENWIELAVAACNDANIKHGAIETIATWDQAYCANAVYRIHEQRYLKLFGPAAERQFHIERAVGAVVDDIYDALDGADFDCVAGSGRCFAGYSSGGDEIRRVGHKTCS